MGLKREAAKAKRKWEQAVQPALAAAKEIDSFLGGQSVSADQYTKFTEQRYAHLGDATGRYAEYLTKRRRVSYDVMNRWKRHHKATYLVDDALLRELSGTPLPEGFVPHSVFRRLPHNTPLFVFATPLPMKMTRFDAELRDVLLTGFIVEPFMLDLDGKLVHTIAFLGHDIELNETLAGTTRIVAEANVTYANDGSELVVASSEGVDLRLMVSIGVGEYGFIDGGANYEEEVEKFKKLNEENPFYRMAIPLILNLVLYTTVEDPDLQQAPVPTVAGRHVVGSSAPQVYELGFRLGALLRGVVRDPITGCEPSDRTVIPHLRRAHWHRYWVGPKNGDRQVVVRWVSQTLVNADAGAYVPAVRPVKQPT
jgi:hypothetical protein